jgi:hypothetical protein
MVKSVTLKNAQDLNSEDLERGKRERKEGEKVRAVAAG